MPYRVPERIIMGYQGINLNCGRYCLEALMIWKHGSPYGAKVVAAPDQQPDGSTAALYGSARNKHTAAVQKHIDTRLRIQFKPEAHHKDYGLIAFAPPDTLAGWEALLRTYGPLIVSGHIGAVRIIPFRKAGHYVLVVGVTATDIEYLDPLRPRQLFGEEPNSLSLQKFRDLAYDRVLAAAK